jgi:phosphoribosylaminoimidazole-succinocarboxamide synthase
VDGKKEFGYDVDGTLMLVDVFGTLDEDRFWDRLRYEKENECIELSKEAVRQYYRKTGYKDELYDAREKELSEPPIPPLPKGIIDEVSSMYVDVARQICGSGS